MQMLLIALISATVATQAAAAGICVQNASATGYVFVAHADDGTREVADLASGEILCSAGDAKGTVAVFASRDDLEGCSRRIPANTTERLILFPHVDLCTWERMR
ncbi:MAG: hypothetical protein KJO67_05805 [Silicimonas sp.]|nr:hypothetical protein [Silicimonas sp.]